jgi:hypothetical protein
MPQSSIQNIVSLEEMKLSAEVFFPTVHPFFSTSDLGMIEKRPVYFWISQQRGTDLEACVCGVVALGSYFSPVPSTRDYMMNESWQEPGEAEISCAGSG